MPAGEMTELMIGGQTGTPSATIARCQEAINAHAATLGVAPVAVDGRFGPDTQEAFESVAWFLGIDVTRDRGVSWHARCVLSDLALRSAHERQWAADRRTALAIPLTSQELMLG